MNNCSDILPKFQYCGQLFKKQETGTTSGLFCKYGILKRLYSTYIHVLHVKDTKDKVEQASFLKHACTT